MSQQEPESYECQQDRTIFCIQCQEHRNLLWTLESDTQDRDWAEYSCGKCGAEIDFENPDIHKNLDQKFNSGSWCFICNWKQPLRGVYLFEFERIRSIARIEMYESHRTPNKDGNVGVCIHCWLKMYVREKVK